MRSSSRMIWLTLLVLTFASAGIAEKPLTNGDVINLIKIGLDDSAVIAKIRQAPAVSFTLGADDLVHLKASGASSGVIAAMLDRSSRDSQTTNAGEQYREPGSSTAVREPEFVGTVAALDVATGNLTPLERLSPMHRIHVKALGYGGGEGFFEVSGERSPVRFRSGQPLAFVVLAASQQVDPRETVQLFVWDSADKHRRLPIDSAGSMGLSSHSLIRGYLVPTNATRYGRSSFKVTAVEPLAGGEYGFTATGTEDRFFFGIDSDAAFEASRLAREVPFHTGEPIPLGIVERLVRISSVEVTGWPGPKQLEQGQVRPDDKTNLTVVFTYTNEDRRNWACKYRVTVLDAQGLEIGLGERDASLDRGQIDDTNRIHVSMRTNDFSRAAKLRIQVQPRPD